MKNSLSILEEETKKWNQNRLFLLWGFTAAFVGVTGIELFKIIAKDYHFRISEVVSAVPDYYFIGMLFFFIFSLTLTLKASKIIDTKANILDTTLKTLSKKSNHIKK